MTATIGRRINERLAELRRVGITDEQIEWAAGIVAATSLDHLLYARQGEAFSESHLDHAVEASRDDRDAWIICAIAGQRRVVQALKRCRPADRRSIDLELRRRLIPDNPAIALLLIDSMPANPSTEALQLTMKHITVKVVRAALKDGRNLRAIAMERMVALGDARDVRTKQRGWAILARYGSERIKRNGIPGHLDPAAETAKEVTVAGV